MLPSSLLRTMAVYYFNYQVLHQLSLKLIPIEPYVAFLTAVTTALLEGVDIQGPDKDILFNIPSQ